MGLSRARIKLSAVTGGTVIAEVRCHATIREAVAADWDQVLAPVPFLSTEWLSALGPAAQGGAGGPATVYVQAVDEAGSVRLQCLRQRLPVAEMKLGPSVRAELMAHLLGSSAYQLGQALFSGPAFATDLPAETLPDAFATLPAALDGRGTWLLKDSPVGLSKWWLPLEALPEMSLEISREWRRFDDYVQALPSKYRRRVRRARKKLGALELKHLNPDDAERFSESLDDLYARLIVRTAYAPFVVPPGYVARLKKLRPRGVALLGYFDGAKLVGFATLLQDGRQGLAHLAAVDASYTRTHQLYLNMLLDLLAEAIARGCGKLNYGRTATTIKSSIGARPVEYASAIRHTGCLRHGLLRRIVPLVFDPQTSRQLVQDPFGVR